MGHRGACRAATEVHARQATGPAAPAGRDHHAVARGGRRRDDRRGVGHRHRWYLPPINGLRNPTQATHDGDVGTSYAAVGFLVLLAVAKLVATCLSTGSGSAIGTFARAILLVKAYQQAVSRSPALQRKQNGEVVMPNGDTLLQSEDEVTVLADLDHIDDVHGLLTGDAVHPPSAGAEPCM